MAKEVVMPKLGLTMTEGTVEAWLKNEGDEVKEGEKLFSVSTDKLTNDIEATVSGKLLKILVPAGETVACHRRGGRELRRRPCQNRGPGEGRGKIRGGRRGPGDRRRAGRLRRGDTRGAAGRQGHARRARRDRRYLSQPGLYAHKGPAAQLRGL